MKPSKFLELVPPLPHNHNNLFIENHIRSEQAIGSPFLMIKIPNEWMLGNFHGSIGFASVYGHEGRNRMTKILEIFGDDFIEVHLFIRTKNDEKINRSEITNEIIINLNKLMTSEKYGWTGDISSLKGGRIVWGPIFEKVLN